MQNTPFSFGPLALTTTLTTNILNPPVSSGGVNAGTPNTYLLIKHIRVLNKTSVAATFSLWLGATGANIAGTEVIGQGQSVPANSSYDYFSPGLKIKTNQFLVGGASAATTLTIQGEGEIGLEL